MSDESHQAPDESLTIAGSSDNPPENQLGAGVTAAALLEAIELSGYPLQTRVSGILREFFDWVRPESAFIDQDSGELRTIDLETEAALWDLKAGDQPSVRPVLNLLVECKQSELPYVFFLLDSEESHWLPLLTGIGREWLDIRSDVPGTRWMFPLAIIAFCSRRFDRDSRNGAMKSQLPPPLALSTSSVTSHSSKAAAAPWPASCRETVCKC